jgi:hypothetical protein
MNNADYLPRNDAKLLAFARNLFSNLNQHAIEWNIDPNSYTEISQRTTAFEDALRKLEDPNHGKVDVLLKNDIKKDLMKEIRSFLKEYIIYNHLVSQEDLLAIGIKPRDDTPSRSPVPTDIPVGEVDTSTHQQHTVHVKAGNLTGKTKPDKTVTGFELWRTMGDNPPKTDEEWTYVDFSSRSSMIVKYPLADVGKTIYYRFRWVNTRNEKGPWCEGYLIAVVP